MENDLFKSLVADYDSSSDEDTETVEPGKGNQTVTLASAGEMLGKKVEDTAGSVFTNPYQLAENYQQSILEKHVKMTEVKVSEKKTTRTCFKFLKGKCRLNDKCPYLHQNPNFIKDSEGNASDEEARGTKMTKKSKRSGLKDDLVPPKKFLKLYQKTNNGI